MMPPKNYTHTNFENKLHNSIRDEKKIPKLATTTKKTPFYVFVEGQKKFTHE